MTSDEKTWLYVLRILELFAFDNCDRLFWRTDGEYAPVTIMVECNDVFAWGSADCERIELDDIPALEKAFEDVKMAGDTHYAHAPELFCARKRKMRPQGALYEYLDEDVWPLFDACGPERAVGLGNPDRHPAPSSSVSPEAEA